VVTTNDLSEASLRRCVEQSEVLARLAPDDPEAMPELEPQQYAQVDAYMDSTAASARRSARRRRSPRSRRRARRGTSRPPASSWRAAGCNAIANNKGLFAYHRGTSVNYTLTVRTTDGTGSGWAAADHPDWRQIDFERVSRAPSTRRGARRIRSRSSPVATP
jgi:predicted Zn-dependent protease